MKISKIFFYHLPVLGTLRNQARNRRKSVQNRSSTRLQTLLNSNWMGKLRNWKSDKKMLSCDQKFILILFHPDLEFEPPSAPKRARESLYVAMPEFWMLGIAWKKLVIKFYKFGPTCLPHSCVFKSTSWTSTGRLKFEFEPGWQSRFRWKSWKAWKLVGWSKKVSKRSNPSIWWSFQ